MCGIHGLLGGFYYSFQKKGQPGFPVPLNPNFLQEIVISVPMHFEIEAEVQERFGQSAFDTEKEGDQDSSEASVTIEKRVNSLELNMTDRCLKR